MATRFLTQVADIAENRPAMDLFLALQTASAGGTELTQAQIDVLVDQAMTAAENQPPLPALLEHYSLLDFDFSADAITGDVAAFNDGELQSLPLDPNDPWAGYGAWRPQRNFLFEAIDPDGVLTSERHRAYTGNRALPIMLEASVTQANGTVGNDNLIAATTGSVDLPTLFNGGGGNDTISGGTKNDAFVFGDGFGNDTISDPDGSADEIAFQGSLTSELARLQFVPGSRTDLLISFADRTDTLTVVGFFSSTGATQFETLSFADGNTLTADEIRYQVLLSQATAGAETITGFIVGGEINGLGGDDELRGARGEDLLVGGTGNDLLIGYDGDDTYRFERGDGQDIIRDSVIQTASYDTLEFGSGIAPSDITASQADNGRDIILQIAGTTDQVTLDQTINDWTNRIDLVRFADGTEWTAAELLSRATAPTAADDAFYGGYNNDVLQGGAGNDTLIGRGGHDTLIGGPGNDLLMGNDGGDTYRFALGDGQDIIRDDVQQTGGDNVIYFGPGIAPGDVTVAQTDGGNDLVLSINGTTDQITLDATVNYWTHRIDRVYFEDGTVWSAADLLSRATAPTSGADVFYGGYNDDTLLGGAGADTLYGRGGEDILIGGIGNDLLIGGGGEDVYRFNRGDGQDIVRDSTETSSNDTIEFGADILPGDVTVVQADNGNDIVLIINGTNDQITLGRVDKRDSQIARVLLQGCSLGSSHGPWGLVGRGMGTDRTAVAV